ncbi:MAG: NAD-dependent epimerase/dehydratase family protein [Clostridia bacterium]|nr:NAD-dependent epimerase/dehydratase family protein [Clostridia bacterium]
MRKILIIGANSYIGTSFEEYILNSEGNYIVDTVDVIDGSWRERSFKGYDTIIHVAGIAHIKESEDNKDLYYKVNYELAVEVANKAKEEGIKQFIFLSSMSVYGMDIGIITKKTYPNPVTNYGKSKLMAENDIRKIEDAEFKVAVVRPPMIYGEGCKVNYNALIKFAEKMPIFPNVDNRRSMLRIDTLCSYLKDLIDNEKNGLFFPQDKEYVCTSDMVKNIAKDKGREIHLTKGLNGLVWLAKKMPGRIGRLANKAFGTLVYESDMK